MPNKRHSERHDVATELSYREFAVRASSLDEAGRSVEAIISTEAPVPMPDYQRGEIVPEVLLTSGAQFPSSRQVPFLDSHARNSTSDQLGSVRTIRTDGEIIVGRLHFDESANTQWNKVRAGHITDVSAGYQVLKRTYVAQGKTATVGGRSFTGPVNVVTSWRLKEVSLVPIGADDQAKLRGFKPQSLKGNVMNPELKAKLIARGMPADLSDEAATTWAMNRAAMEPDGDETAKKKAEEEAAAKAKEDAAKAAKNITGRSAGNDGASSIDPAVLSQAVRAALDEQRKIEAGNLVMARNLCELAGTPDLANRCAELGDEASMRKFLLEERAKQSTEIGSSFRLDPGPQQLEKHRGALGTALTLRSLQNTGVASEKINAIFPVDKRAKDAHIFQHASLYDLAREALEMDGVRTRGASRESIAIAALGWPEKVNMRATGPGYHQTASFPKLVQDAINKSMQVGYTEFPATWLGPMRQGASVADFKQIHRMRMGAIPNVPVWPDNTNPEQASFADADETYAVEAYSYEISFSWRLLINDDMDALSRAPAQLGNAFSRTVNKAAWSKVTGNPTMSDGKALFLETAAGNRKRSNLTTGSASPTVSTIQTMTNKMMQMRGENTPEGNESDDILNLMPSYIIGPGALRTTILQLVKSIADPASTNQNTYNPTNNLIPVIEPLLDVNSTTAWYLFANPSQIDTIEVSFLQGQESPVLRDWMDERSLSRSYAGVQTFAAAALNHRGVQRHDGS